MTNLIVTPRTLKKRPIRCPQSWVSKYQSDMRNI